MKRRADWKPVSGLMHAYIEAAYKEKDALKKSPDYTFRVARIATGYMVQVKVWR